jgi:hypothetical protein
MHSGLLRCIGLLHGLPIHIPKLIPCLIILCVLVPYLFCIWWFALGNSHPLLQNLGHWPAGLLFVFKSTTLSKLPLTRIPLQLCKPIPFHESAVPAFIDCKSS